MNDNLNVIVTVYNQGRILKCAVQVQHGLNQFLGWEYFKEPDIKKR